jgi:sRNA-binding protein
MKRKPTREAIEVVNYIIGLLSEKFSHTFNLYERKRLPLKIGIHHDILAEVKGISPVELKLALGVYTANKFYRAQLRAGAPRIDLAGKPAGVVAEQVKPPPPNTVATLKVEIASAALPPANLFARRMSLADLKAAARARNKE